MTLAYVGLGSNLGDPARQLADARHALADLPQTRLLLCSPLYCTAPWGGVEQPDFINAVVALDTALTPHALLDALLSIEQHAGRVRTVPNGPRTLDLDLLHMQGMQLEDARLQLPHPRMAGRAFVLLPLKDIAADLLLPGLGSVAELLAALDTSGCKRLP